MFPKNLACKAIPCSSTQCLCALSQVQSASDKRASVRLHESLFLLAAVSLHVRHASKKAGGSTKNRKGSNAQRLGVKLFHGQACKPGSIIIRQRGTKWKPADNVGLGKDHTIFSLFHGHVQFFKHPETKRTHVRVQPRDEAVLEPKNKTGLPFHAANPLQVEA